jgi:hypothetical protein
MFTVKQNGVRCGAFVRFADADRWARSHLGDNFEIERLF